MSKNNSSIKEICRFYKENKEVFDKSIEIFSKFMTLTNDEYAYNKTYLESYTKELDVLTEKFISRDEFLLDIYKNMSSKLNKANDVAIVIDNIWKLNSNGMHYMENRGKYILNDYMTIKFEKDETIVDVKRFYGSNINLNEIISFLDEHLEGKII